VTGSTVAGTCSRTWHCADRPQWTPASATRRAVTSPTTQAIVCLLCLPTPTSTACFTRTSRRFYRRKCRQNEDVCSASETTTTKRCFVFCLIPCLHDEAACRFGELANEYFYYWLATRKLKHALNVKQFLCVSVCMPSCSQVVCSQLAASTTAISPKGLSNYLPGLEGAYLTKPLRHI